MTQMVDAPGQTTGNIEFEIEDPQHPKKRRRRNEFACLSCRKRKAKCDQGQPCATCVKHGFTCEYTAEHAKRLALAQRDGSNDQRQAMTLRTGPCDDAATPSSATRYVPIAAAPRIPSRSDVLPSDTSSEAQRAMGYDSGNACNANDFLPSAATTDLESQRQHGQAGLPAVNNEEQDELGGVNYRTQGTEFYGAMGTFPFLSKLRLQARSQYQKTNNVARSSFPDDRSSARPDALKATESRRGPRSNAQNDASIVNLLHSVDYPVGNDKPRQATKQSPSLHAKSSELPGQRSLALDVERECARLYFRNLHYIHPILNPELFFARCEQDIWSASTMHTARTPTERELFRRFYSLYNIVLAIGAITAGDESDLVQRREAFLACLLPLESSLGIAGDQKTYSPIRIARIYFERAKTDLGDIFESCSLETTQTLFLMSVFCQNALKPHSCYLYNGMAVRTALATGMPSQPAPSEADCLLWWALYSYEIEMCASAGREASLDRYDRYRMPLPRQGGQFNHALEMTRCMVHLAQLQHEVFEEIYSAHTSRESKSKRALELEGRLYRWMEGLPSEYSFNEYSLRETEAVAKQKIVLRLRFNTTLILLHRPFLTRNGIAASEESRASAGHIHACVEAARNTIAVLFDAYANRPYFRTWWYNCTYALYASMILLYVVITDCCPIAIHPETLLRDSRRSLEIFRAMDAVHVSRQCAKITQEVYEAAEQAVATKRDLHKRESSVSTTTISVVGKNTLPAPWINNDFERQPVDPLTEAGSMQPIWPGSSALDSNTMNIGTDPYAGLIGVDLLGGLFEGSGMADGLWPDNLGNTVIATPSGHHHMQAANWPWSPP